MGHCTPNFMVCYLGTVLKAYADNLHCTSKNAYSTRRQKQVTCSHWLRSATCTEHHGVIIRIINIQAQTSLE